GKAGKRLTGQCEDLVVVRLDLGLVLRQERTVTRREAEIRRALKDREVSSLRGDLGCGLNAARSRPNEPDTLAGEVHGLAGPRGSEVHVTFEVVQTRDIGHIRRREASDRGHEIARGDSVV